MMQKRCRIIYNPTSGREAIKNDLVEILNILERAGYETSAFATTPEENSARNEAERAARAGFIPGTGEPGGLPSMGSHRVRHD